MKKFETAQRLLFAAPLLLLLGTAQAGITIHTGTPSFLTAATALGSETFAGVSLEEASPSPLLRSTQTGTLYHYEARASTSTFLGAGGDSDVWLTPNVATDSVTFSGFSGGITAFGGHFFGTDFNGQYLQGDITVTVTDALGGVVTRVLAGATTDSFLGFTTDGPLIVSVSFASASLPSGDSVWPAARQLWMGQSVSAVPEPSMALLLLLGLACLPWAAREGHSLRR